MYDIRVRLWLWHKVNVHSWDCLEDSKRKIIRVAVIIDYRQFRLLSRRYQTITAIAHIILYTVSFNRRNKMWFL